MRDVLARVLAHPLRHRLLLEYHREPANPGAVARRLGEPLNLVSYHTRVLARHRLVELVRTERRRGAVTHFYRSTAAQVIEVADWEALPGRARRVLVLSALAQSGEEARRAALDGGFDLAYAHLSRSPLELDEQGLREVERCLRATVDQIAGIEAVSRRRASARRVPFEVIMLGFRAPSLRDGGAPPVLFPPSPGP
jgi:DNA-binding transcriptional ArsR family regulator